MKVLLINPIRKAEYYTKRQFDLCKNRSVQIALEKKFPLEFSYIGALIKEEKKHQIEYIDAHNLDIADEEVIKTIKDYAPDAIGIPTEQWLSSRCPIPFLNHVNIAVKLIRGASDAKIVLWGQHPTVFPEKTLEETKADIALIGEPEETFVKIVNNLTDLNKVEKGVCYRGENGFVNKGQGDIVDLEKMPVADFSLMENKGYKLGSLLASRGCPYKCSFCSSPNLNVKFRNRNIEKLRAEWAKLKEIGVKHVLLEDETFSVNISRSIQICNMIKEISGNKITWSCQTRLELLTEDLIKAMKESGCNWVGVGFESASMKILQNVQKHASFTNLKKTVSLFKKYDLTLNFFTINFLPGETEETLEETIRFFNEVKPQLLSTTTATPIPGTQLWYQGLNEGKLKTGEWEEALELSGTVGTDFTPEEISEWIEIIPTKYFIAADKKMWGTNIKKAFAKPSQAIHYANKLSRFVQLNFKRKLRSVKQKFMQKN